MTSTLRPLMLFFTLATAASVSAQPSGSEAWCAALGSSLSIDTSDISLPVSAVTITAATWFSGEANPAAQAPQGPGGPGGFGGPRLPVPMHCRIDGELAPVDTAATARPIKFGVALPPEWNGRSIQMGGGGMNGNVPGLADFGAQSDLARGYVTYGSDSGHGTIEDEWALNDEAIKNLGHMQMNKTHDAAMAVIEQAYGSLPEYNYYVGGSQGGREALTVVQRYPEDYDGVLATVPIVGFSSLMTGPTRMRIQEKPLVNWVTPAKGQAILTEFMRQCDNLDGLDDGIINNYTDCRAIFNINDGQGPTSPWQSLQCPGNVDPHPENTGPDACLTTGQTSTLELLFSDLDPGIELPNGRTDFGMWAPSTAVASSGPFGGLFIASRFNGQEGTAADAPDFVALGSIGVTGFIMEDIDANPLDFDLQDHGPRYQKIAPWLDSTQSDLSDYADQGGKLIVIIGTDDTIAPSGEQLNYYQMVLDTMGRRTVNEFARLWVLPQTGHGLTGRSAAVNGAGETIESKAIPASLDRFALLARWVEEGVAPGLNETVTGESGSLPICSFPAYPHYESGPADQASSYTCAISEYAN